MPTNESMDPKLAKKLSVLQDMPLRSSQQAERGRAAFLAQAEGLAAESALPQPISPAGKGRPVGWMQALRSVFVLPNKERLPLGTLITILLIVTVLFGGGATVAAAQGSLPDQALYPLKTWSEALRASLSTSDQARLELAMELSGRRSLELQAMLRAGQTPPGAVQARFNEQVSLALQLAAGQADPQAQAALARIQSQLRAQQQAFNQLQAPGNPEAQAVLQQVRTMLQTQLRLCEEGLQDPALLRQRLRSQQQEQIQNTPVHNENQYQYQYRTGTAAGPQGTGTPTVGSGPGPGEGSGTPAGSATGSPAGNGPGPQATNAPGTGPGPQPTDAPGSGPGPGPQPTSEPGTGPGPQPGDGSGPGPQPTHGSGGGGGRQ